MKSSTAPNNEAQRLSALYQSNLLDSIREDSFDAITMITAQTCGMPVALITLVDEKRIWFKSRHGIDGVTEISRNVGFCSNTITQSELLEIKDATVDKRFYDNPMVTENNFQYYAGVPLITIEGYALGTLCVMDKQPRALSEENKEFLKRMAFTIVALIEARINSNKNSSAINPPEISSYNINSINPTAENDYNNLHYAKIFIIDEDEQITYSLNRFFLKHKISVEIHSSPEQFFTSNRDRDQASCLICDTNFYNYNNSTLQKICNQKEIDIPIIFITAKGDIATSVAAMRAGAIDFIEKPLNQEHLLSRVYEALKIDTKKREDKQQYKIFIERLATLTARERQVMELLVTNRASLSNKEVAEKLEISRRTVEVHRSTIMAKMLASSRLELLDIAKICQIDTEYK